MIFGIPQNIFAAIFAFSLNDTYKNSIKGAPSATLAAKAEADVYDLVLMPSFDLLSHKELFVSSKAGISFDGEISNSYLYFRESGAVDSFYMYGDVSSNEIILSKLVFSEKIRKDVEVTIETGTPDYESKNYIVCGNANFEDDLYKSGLSFADQVADLIDAPYVNYVVASKKKEVIEEFNKSLSALDKKIEDNIEKYLVSAGIDESLKSFIGNRLNQIYFEITENEKEGLSEMIRLPFYKGIVKDIVEVKFV